MGQQERAAFPTWEGPSLEQQRSTFETIYERFAVGEAVRRGDDGSETTVRAYELIVDAGDERERKSLIVSFGLRAVQAGYKQSIGPVLLPGVGYADAAASRPLTAAYFFLEVPSDVPVTPAEL